MTTRYRLLPPDAHLMVPTSSTDAALSGLMLYTASRRTSAAAQRIVWHAVERFGPQAVPGIPVRWRAPLDAHAWEGLVGRWEAEIGPFDDIAMHLRRPRSRAGASVLLLRAGRPIAFVKVRADAVARMKAERRALSALGRPMCFAAPSVLSSGSVDRWHYLAMSALPPHMHTVVSEPPLGQIVAEYAAALADQIPRPDGTPPHWQVMHGDLTPWNLRALVDGQMVLFDWEDVSWGPPRADLLWYDAVVRAVHLDARGSGVSHTDEAAAFWIKRIDGILSRGPSSLSAKIQRMLRRGWRG